MSISTRPLPHTLPTTLSGIPVYFLLLYLNAVNTDCARTPRQPNSTGNSQVYHPRSLYRVRRSVYMAFRYFVCTLAYFLQVYS